MIYFQYLSEARATPNVTLIGLGLTPEGINQNYVMYDFMLEQGYNLPNVNVPQW